MIQYTDNINKIITPLYFPFMDKEHIRKYKDNLKGANVIDIKKRFDE